MTHDAGERMAATLRARLTEAFDPDHLEVIDESEAHRGHAGWREGGGTHFRVVMRSAASTGSPASSAAAPSTGRWPPSSPAGCTR